MGVYTNMAANYVNKIGDNPVLESLQFSLDMQKADHAMFEALIELDFDEVYQEAGLSVYTEADVKAGRKFSLKAIKEKVIGYINKFIDTVKRFAAKIIAKLQEIFDKDRKLVKKYGENFKKKASARNFKEQEIPDFNKVDVEMKKLESGNIMKDKDVSDFLAEMTGFADIETVNMKQKDDIEMIQDAVKEIRNRKLDDYFTKLSGKLSGSQISTIQSYMETGLQASIRSIKANAKNLEASLNKSKNYYKSGNFSDSRMDGDDANAATLSSAIGKASIAILSAASSLVSAQKNFNLNLIKKTYADTRKIFVMGSQDNPNTSEDSTSVNASYEYTLGVLSDNYIEEAFA